MKVINKVLIASTLGLSIGSMAQAGDFRFGGGVTEWDEVNVDYTIIEAGYDYDRILGFTVDYGIPEFDAAPDRLNIAAEFGYEFGDEFTIRPYGALGLIHIRGAGAAGSTSGMLGAGVRAAYKFLYIDAGYSYNFENNNNITRGDENTPEDGFIWVWDNHDNISLTAGFKF